MAKKREEFLLEACSINFNSEEYRQELHCKQKLRICAVSYEGPQEDRSLGRKYTKQSMAGLKSKNGKNSRKDDKIQKHKGESTDCYFGGINSPH